MEKICLAYITANGDIDLQLKSIDFSRLSHIAVAFLKFKEKAGEWSISLSSAVRTNIEKIKNEIAKQNADTKILLSVGGAGADGFCYASHTAETRQRFAESIVLLVDELGIDGIDVDWEFPGESALGIASCKSCKKDFVLFLEELKKQLENRLLTIAVGSNRYFGIDVRRVNRVVDFVFVMTYDLGLMQSNLYLSKAFVTMWHILGISKEKLCIGVPLYGRKLKNLEEDESFEALSKGKITHFFGQSFSEYNGAKWCFDTESDVRKKAEWAAKKNLAGIFCWEITRDENNRMLNAMYLE